MPTSAPIRAAWSSSCWRRVCAIPTSACSRQAGHPDVPVRAAAVRADRRHHRVACRRSAGTSSAPSSMPATTRCAQAQARLTIPRRFSLGRARDVRAAAAARASARPARAAPARASALPRRLRPAAAARAVRPGLRRDRRTGGPGCRRSRRRSSGDMADALAQTARAATGGAPDVSGRRRRRARRRRRGAVVTRPGHGVWQPAYVGLGQQPAGSASTRCCVACAALQRLPTRAWCCHSPLYVLQPVGSGGAAGLRQRRGGSADPAAMPGSCWMSCARSRARFGTSRSSASAGARGVIDLDLLVYGAGAPPGAGA